jgi:uncharacterized protein (DUF433 family)
MATTTSIVRPLGRYPYSGIYTIPEAALYLRSTTPTSIASLRNRHRQGHDFVAPSARHLYTWIRRGLEWDEAARADARHSAIDFTGLIRLRMIVIMRSRGLPFKAIREAEVVARQLTGSQQPFVTEDMWTSSSDIFVQAANTLFAASRGPQPAMDFLREYLEPVHHGLIFGPGEKVSKWRPAPGVLIDPRVQFGAPCIEGTRIQTEVIGSLHLAGDSAEALAELYGRPLKDIEAAIAWEQRLAAAA